MDIRSHVISLARKYRTTNPFDLASSMGIVVLTEPLGEIYGFFNSCYRQKFIYLNQDLEEEQTRFTCAHELGHSILHPKLSTPFLRKNTLFSVDKLELEANRFAVELTYSDFDLHPFLGRNITEASAYMGVPLPLAAYRMSTVQPTLWAEYD